MNIKLIGIAICVTTFVNLSSCAVDDNCVVQDIENGTVEYDPYAWIHLGCMTGGMHFFNGASVYEWKSSNNDEPIFLANGDVITKYQKNFSFMQHKFKKIHALNTDAVTKGNLNNMLNNELLKYGFDKAESYEDVKLIRLLSGAEFSYEIAIFHRENIPNWVIVCKTYCNSEEPILIKVALK